MPGFEDVIWQDMFIEMLKALPCFILSMLLWWKVLKARSTKKIVKKRMDVERLKEILLPINIKKRAIHTINSLSLWKWATALIIIGLYIIIGTFIKGNNDLYTIGIFFLFLFIAFISGIYSTEDIENTLLITAVGLLGSRHGAFFNGFNVFYPIGSLIIATAIFLPGEIKAAGLEKKNKLHNKTEVIEHNRIAYFLSKGFFITSILYFLTSF